MIKKAKLDGFAFFSLDLCDEESGAGLSRDPHQSSRVLSKDPAETVIAAIFDFLALSVQTCDFIQRIGSV